MPHRSRRVATLVAVLALTALATATAAGCTAAGGAPPDAPAGPAPSVGLRTRIEVPVAGGAMVTEVLQVPGRASGHSWSEDGSGPAGRPQPLLEEIRIGTDHWVRLPVLVREGVLEDGWIHFDLTDPGERTWLEANAVGLLDQDSLWSAKPGDPYGDDEVDAVGERGARHRVLRLASGLELHVTREVLRADPGIAPPDPATVVPFREVAELLVPG